ncbi:sporulation histidine kinase inhibitor Sda [Caldalkalibacillus salinus]|uniref:sporulation histidine kinase inhibitor Sda n=1 Tax=Caldalkalibacillus salinus TaxID=2803787 RepID=UPI00192435A7|nr:sporulation histidine kinase inhibitor Sda [Caldalkalibacillus salinus]
MKRLTDAELVEAYMRAKELNCSPDFIDLLFEEIERRNIEQTKYELRSVQLKLSNS